VCLLKGVIVRSKTPAFLSTVRALLEPKKKKGFMGNSMDAVLAEEVAEADLTKGGSHEGKGVQGREVPLAGILRGDKRKKPAIGRIGGGGVLCKGG